MERRLFLLPVAWVVFGIGLALALQFLLAPISSVIPAAANDKPISGALLTMLGLSSAATFGVIGISMYSLGYWEPRISGAKAWRDVAVFAVLLVSIFLVFYTPLALFPLILAGFYLLATNIE